MSTKAKLLDFLNSTPGHNGHVMASKAVRFVADNSWSVMESLLYMLLTLPNKYGGFGLTGAVLNRDIRLRPSSSLHKGTRFVADLYWDCAKLVVEYDSYAFHNNAESWVKDARRLSVLEAHGYKTLSVNTAQLYSESALKDSALAIARYLGKRLRIRTEKFEQQHALLRSLLPGICEEA